MCVSEKRCSLQAFVKHVVEHAGLKDKAQKRVSEHLSDDEDLLTFLRGIRTSSGRMVKVVIRALMRTVYCVVCVAAMPLPYETLDNTGKDIVLVRTHNTKELQVSVTSSACVN